MRQLSRGPEKQESNNNWKIVALWHVLVQHCVVAVWLLTEKLICEGIYIFNGCIFTLHKLEKSSVAFNFVHGH